MSTKNDKRAAGTTLRHRLNTLQLKHAEFGYVMLENDSSICPFILEVCLSFARFFRLAVCMRQSVRLYLQSVNSSTPEEDSEGKVNRKLRFGAEGSS